MHERLPRTTCSLAFSNHWLLAYQMILSLPDACLGHKEFVLPLDLEARLQMDMEPGNRERGEGFVDNNITLS
jgi:hypothetical protein